MLETCEKCKLQKQIWAHHLGDHGKKLNFCKECVWRLEKIGYPDIQSFLDDPVKFWNDDAMSKMQF